MQSVLIGIATYITTTPHLTSVLLLAIVAMSAVSRICYGGRFNWLGLATVTALIMLIEKPVAALSPAIVSKAYPTLLIAQLALMIALMSLRDHKDRHSPWNDAIMRSDFAIAGAIMAAWLSDSFTYDLGTVMLSILDPIILVIAPWLASFALALGAIHAARKAHLDTSTGRHSQKASGVSTFRHMWSRQGGTR